MGDFLGKFVVRSHAPKRRVVLLGSAALATVARPAHMLETKTRTMPVELDALNPDGSLSPGMYTAIKWPVRRSKPVRFFAQASSTFRTALASCSLPRGFWIKSTPGSRRPWWTMALREYPVI